MPEHNSNLQIYLPHPSPLQSQDVVFWDYLQQTGVLVRVLRSAEMIHDVGGPITLIDTALHAGWDLFSGICSSLWSMEMFDLRSYRGSYNFPGLGEYYQHRWPARLEMNCSGNWVLIDFLKLHILLPYYAIFVWPSEGGRRMNSD